MSRVKSKLATPPAGRQLFAQQLVPLRIGRPCVMVCAPAAQIERVECQRARVDDLARLVDGLVRSR